VEEVAARDGYRSIKDPDMEGLGTGGKAQALQIAGTERGSGSGDLRGFSFRSPSSSASDPAKSRYASLRCDSLFKQRRTPGRFSSLMSLS